MRIGLYIDLRNTHDRFIYRILARSVRERGWTIDQSHGVIYPPEKLRKGSVDAYVGWIRSQEALEAVQAAQVPAINFTYLLRSAVINQITHDHFTVGTMAADYLLGLGLESAAILAQKAPAYSAERVSGFLNRWKTHRPESEVEIFYDVYTTHHYFEGQRKLGAPSQSLFCVTDELALLAINNLEQNRILVPQDVAVVGVGAEQLFSLCLGREIASVLLDHNAIAAGILRMLEQIQKNPKAPLVFERVQPFEVVPGETARLPLPSDESLRSAFELFNGNDLSSLDLNSLARKAGMSRRNFERKFKQATNQSPGSAIQEARLFLAKRMLSDTSITVEEIVERCGLAERSYFSVWFKKLTGFTPSAYRKRVQKHSL